MVAPASRLNRGFTLIELLIAVAIVSILTAIGFVSYLSFIDKSRINSAQADLAALSLVYENQYQRVLSYPANDINTTAALKANFSTWQPGSEATDFAFSSDNASTSSYTVKATGLVGKLQGCVISLTHNGIRTIASCNTYASDGKWL